MLQVKADGKDTYLKSGRSFSTAPANQQDLLAPFSLFASKKFQRNPVSVRMLSSQSHHSWLLIHMLCAISFSFFVHMGQLRATLKLNIHLVFFREKNNYQNWLPLQCKRSLRPVSGPRPDITF